MDRALRMAVVNQLRQEVPNGCAYDKSVCDEGPPDGQPPPIAGKLWVSVHGVSHTSEQDGCVEESYSLSITVSMRINVPFDRIALVTIQEAARGLNDECAKIKAALLNQQYAVMNEANFIINQTNNGPWDGFVEPFFRIEGNDPDWTSGDWFHGEPMKSAAVRKTLRLTGAKRIQRLGNVQ